ncbi:MAG: hypothetical protein KatS3mg068_1408 [Candidatus Sericytochromatia bacterium]|nr:MAG: hypothetical protein KatS3mg068_1408 [Candidatus Sericytochromatia bacterium]
MLYRIIIFALFFNFIFVNYANSEIITSEKIGKIFKRKGISNFNSSVSIISLKTGDSIFDYNKERLLAPASNMKILTSSAALKLLKPEHRFRTVIYSDSYIKNGIINGNIYIKGYGDPDLTYERLAKTVRKLKNYGLKEVQGDLIADESFFDSQDVGKGWKIANYGNSVYSARISALSINRNTIEVWVRSGEKNGDKGIITLEPENDFFIVENKLITGGSYPNLIITRDMTKEGRNKIIVKGSIPLGNHSEINKMNLENPCLYTGYVFAKLLQKEGIKINGKIRKSITPQNVIQLIETQSRPLSNIIYDFNKNSVNIIGEILLKYLGAVFRGKPGTIEKGADVLKKDFLENIVKVDTKGIVIADGSGLSPMNRISANHLVQVLKYMYSDISVQPDLLASLPLSGADGTLERRTKNTLGERKFRAKTGFINNVSALSGYVFSKDGTPFAFSLLFNNFYNLSTAISIQDEIATYIANNIYKE